MKKLLFIPGILLVLVLIGFFLGSSSEKFVCGIIIDLANQPIPEIPMMLYKTDDKEDCLYAAISNRKGEFQLRYPGIGTYYLTTILDQDHKALQKFSIKEEADLVNLRIVYSGSIRETTHVTMKTKPKPAPKVVKKEVEKPVPQEVEQPNPTPQPTVVSTGKLQGTIINSDGSSVRAKSFQLEQETENQIDRITVELTNGEFILTDLMPGKYKFAPIIDDTKSAKKEIDIVSGETSYIEFTLDSKKQDTKETSNLSVTVIDSTWTPQSGVNIVVDCLDAGTRYENATDENGEVIFTNIESGSCQIHASFQGVNGFVNLEESMILKPGKFSGTVLRQEQ